MHAYTSANKTIADLQTQKVSHCNTLRAQTKLSYEVPFWYLEIGHPLWPNNGGLILQNARFSWLNIKHMHDDSLSLWEYLFLIYASCILFSCCNEKPQPNTSEWHFLSSATVVLSICIHLSHIFKGCFLPWVPGEQTVTFISLKCSD